MGWARGGYLGVSLFFTLSGFLITGLLLEELDGAGRVALGPFWARRLRRLLPAATVTLLAVGVVAPALATADQLARLRGDVLASLASVVNWRFLAQGRDYGALFTAPSPVLHLWSLAIEAQCYLGLPVVVAAVGRRRRLLAVVLALLVAGGTAVAFTAPATTAYYSTVARAPELLVGSLLALAVSTRRLPRAVALLGPPGLLALVVAWATVPVGADALRRGGFLAHAAVAAVVVAAAQVPGPLRSLLSAAPLAALGRVSYGLYLFHWPIFVWLTPARARGLDGAGLVAVQIGLAVTLAALSFRLLEAPIRRGQWRIRLAPPAVAAVLAVAVLVVAVTAEAPDGAREFTAAEGFVADGPSPPGLPRVAVFGDSTALRTAFGLPLWGIRTRRIATVGDETVIGCSLARGGLIDATGTPRPVLEGCDDWPDRWRRRVRELAVDAAVVQFGPWDVADRRLPGDDRWRHVGDPVYDEFLRGELREAVAVLSSSGAKVLWLTSPRVEMERSLVPRPPAPHPSSDPARMDRLNELVREVAAEHPDVVRVLDLAAHLRARPGGELDPSLRPDGVHVSEEASGEVAAWLGPQIVAALAELG